MAKKERRYWDSDCFLNYLEKEKGKYEMCQAIIDLAEKGEVEIVTSALTLAEVLYLKPHKKVPPADAEKISEFFKRDYILIVELGRIIAEDAQKLFWNYSSLKPKDAVHVATALYVPNLSVLDTFDEDLLKLTGKMGSPPLSIGKPDKPQQSLSFAENEE